MASDEEISLLGRAAVEGRDLEAARRLLAELEREASPEQRYAVAARTVADRLTRLAAEIPQPYQRAVGRPRILVVLSEDLQADKVLRDAAAEVDDHESLLAWSSPLQTPTGSARRVVEVIADVDAQHDPVPAVRDDTTRSELKAAAENLMDEPLPESETGGFEFDDYDGGDYDPFGGMFESAGEEEDDDTTEAVDAEEDVGPSVLRLVGMHLTANRTRVVVPWFVEGDPETVVRVAAAADRLPHPGIVHLVFAFGPGVGAAVLKAIWQHVAVDSVSV